MPGPGETRICLSVSDGGALTEFYEPGPELDAEHWAALEAAARGWPPDASWVGVAGSLPPGAPADGPARLLRVAREAGARVALDVSGEALRLGARGRPRLREGQRRTRRPSSGSASADASSGDDGERAAAAAITHGADGMELATPDGEVLRAAPPRLGAYPVGSGDSALGGFLAALDGGASWPEALDRAVRGRRG